MNRRALLRATAGVGAAGAVPAGAASAPIESASGTRNEDRSVVEVRFWVHESVPERVDEATWREEYVPAFESGAELLDSFLREFAGLFGLDAVYTAVHAHYSRPTDGSYRTADGDITADSLRSQLPWWANLESSVNCHLIWDADTSDDTSLGRSLDRAYVGGDSGECYVNLGFLGAAPSYLFPNMYLHEVLHCLMDRGGTDEHAGGTPRWDGDPGTPTVMATGYANGAANALGGTQVPDADCFGDPWADGTTVGTPEPLPVLTACTLRNLQAFFAGERSIGFQYDLRRARDASET